MLAYGFIRSQADHSLFTCSSSNYFVALLVYVDDIIVARDNIQAILNLKAFLNQQFHIKNLGELKYFLDLEIAKSAKGIALNKKKYALDILVESGYLASKPLSFSMQQNLRLSKNEGILLSVPSSYRRLIGQLSYLKITRPDLAYLV